jgi:hypothetical protein
MSFIFVDYLKFKLKNYVEIFGDLNIDEKTMSINGDVIR